MERLDKFISSQTEFSRKDARELILKGKVCVNEKVVKQIDFKIDENNDYMW